MKKRRMDQLNETFWEIVDANWSELEIAILVARCKKIEDGEEEILFQ